MTEFPAPGLHAADPTRDDPYDGPVAPGDHDPLPEPARTGPRLATAPTELLPAAEDDVPDLDTPANALAALRAEFERSEGVKPKPRTWQIDARPGWAGTFDVDVPETTFTGYRRRAVVKGRRNLDGSPEVSDYHLGLLMLAHFNVGLSFNGTAATDDAGEPLTYRSREFLELAGAKTATAAVAKWYGSTGAVISAGRALVQASGWLDDPTEGEAGGPLD